jgi:O-antigen/teichoic acid export membrane protein
LNSDKFVLAGLIDKRMYGIYSIALVMANVLQGLAQKMCMTIAYPALAEVHRERPRDLARTLSKFQWAYDGIITLLAGVLITGAPAVIGVLYDARYHEAGWMLSILALGVVGLRYQIVEECYQATGAPHLQTLANLLRLCSLVCGVVIGLRFWGVPGAISAVALCQFSVWPLAIWFRANRRIFSWRSEAILIPALVTGLTFGWLLSLAAKSLWPLRIVG